MPPGELGDGRDAAEVLVVVRDLFDTLWGNPASAQDVGEKRPNICHALRTPEGYDQDGLEHVGVGSTVALRATVDILRMACHP